MTEGTRKMELDEIINTLRENKIRRIETEYNGYKMVAYTIRYKNQTLYRVDIHLTKQKTLLDKR